MGNLVIPPDDGRFLRYVATPESIHHRFVEHPFRSYSFGAWRESDQIRGLVVYRAVRLRGLRGAALLAAYGDDLPGLLTRWAGAIRKTGVRLVHVVTSPASPFRDALRAAGTRVTVPYSRNPYHLIARGLRPEAPAVVFELDRWDCVGGDIL